MSAERGFDGGVDETVAKLREYLDVPAVVGYEGPFLRHLAGDFARLGHDVVSTAEAMHVVGPEPEPVVTVHVDRHGLVARGGGHFGYAAHVVKVEDYDEEVVAGRAFVTTACTRLADEPVVAYDPATGEVLGRGTTAHRCGTEAAVDLTAAGLEHVAAGTPVGFALGCVEAGEEVTGQLDNTLSAAMAHVLAARGFRGQVVFTTREEVGWSARRFLDFAAGRLAPTHRLLVLDTSPFPEPSPVRRGVVVLRHRDAGAPFAPEPVARLEAEAAVLGIPRVFKDAEIEARNRELVADGRKPVGLGRTELGRIVELSGGAWNGATVQVPTTGYHTNSETTSRRAIANALALLEAATRDG